MQPMKWQMVWVWASVLMAVLACGGSLVNGAPTESPIEPEKTPHPIGRVGAPNAVNLIAYIGMDWNIYTVGVNSENPTAITTNATIPAVADRNAPLRVYRYPTWNLAGELAYVELSGTVSNQDLATIYVSASDGSTQREIYSSQSAIPFYLYWSPNSEQIGFLSSRPSSGGMALEVAGGEQAGVLARGEPFYWAWSPDGESVFAHIGGTGLANRNAQLAFIDAVQAGETRQLLVNTALFQAPDFSPDGRYVIYATREQVDAPGQLVMADAVSGESWILMDYTGGVAFDWSPTGNQVAFVTGQFVETPINNLLTQLVLAGSLQVADVSDPTAPVITELANSGATTFYWSPDGQQLAFFEQYVDNFELPDEGQIGGRVAAGLARPSQQAEQFLRLKVVALADGEVETVVSFRPTPAFVSTVMPYFAQYQRSTTIWSPDSRQIVISLLVGSERVPHIGVVHAEADGNLRLLDAGFIGFWSWR